MVMPSCGASHTERVPVEPDAPGWLRITTFWPSASESSPATTRVTVSVEPPADHGTMIVTGSLGFQSCATAGPATRKAAVAAMNAYALLPIFVPLTNQTVR